MAEVETPIEEWLTSKPDKKGNVYQYVVLKGAGGGVIRRQGEESTGEARMRRAVEQEAKRRAKLEGKAPPQASRPKGKGREPDKPPRIPDPKAKAKEQRERPTADQLAAAAEVPLEMLVMFIGQGLLGCSFCAAKMRENAPACAAELARSRNPYIRSLLEWWQGMLATAMKGSAVGQLIAYPVVHHLAPDPMYRFVGPYMGMPARPEHGPGRTHVHGPGEAPPPSDMPRQPAPGPPVPQRMIVPMLTPEEAAILAAGGSLPPRNPSLAPQEAAQQPGATSPLPPAVPPSQMEVEKQSLQAQVQALREQAQMRAREQMRVAQMTNGAAGNVPAYRAPDTLNPAQLRQIEAARQSAMGTGTIPNYTGGESAPGTPQAPGTPGTPGAPGADSPLPPEAEA